MNNPEAVLNCMILSKLRPTDGAVSTWMPPGDDSDEKVVFVKITSHSKGTIFDFIEVEVGEGVDFEAAYPKDSYLVTFLDTPTIQNLKDAELLKDTATHPKQAFLYIPSDVEALKSHLDHINRRNVETAHPLPPGIKVIQSIAPKEDYDTKGNSTLFIVEINGQTYRIDGKFDSWHCDPEMVTYRNILEMQPVQLKEKVVTVYE